MLEGTIGSSAGSDGRAEVGDTRRHPVDLQPRRRALLARLSAMSLAGFGRRLDADRNTETAAAAVARAWLEMIDAGHPTISWTAASPTLKDTIGPEEWELAVRSVRAPLGPRRSRGLLARATVEAFPGVPPGPYSVVHFHTDFEERSGVIETVTTCLGEDGRWRVAAYFLRQEPKQARKDLVPGPPGP